MNEALETASEAEGTFRSELIRRALKHYMQQNPDHLEAFYVEEEASQQETASITRTSASGDGPVFDPSTDL
jgi:metal-responsive CopG/Arc/MetJ family transcriptional regulator